MLATLAVYSGEIHLAMIPRAMSSSRRMKILRLMLQPPKRTRFRGLH